MDLYKAKIQSDGILDNLNLIILVRGDFHNKQMILNTWAPTASKITLKYFLADSDNHKTRVHQLDLIGSFLQSNAKNRSFVNFESRYREYFPEYANYFGIPLRQKKSMYVMTNYGKLFVYEPTNLLIDEEVFNHSKYQMSVYYKYAPYGSK